MAITLKKKPAESVPTPTEMHTAFFVDENGNPSLMDHNRVVTSATNAGAPVQYDVQPSDPAPVAGSVKNYAKTVDTKSELFSINNVGDVTQITSGGHVHHNITVRWRGGTPGDIYDVTDTAPTLADVKKVLTNPATTLEDLGVKEGYDVQNGDRILRACLEDPGVEDQVANGIYVAQAGAWPRATDADTGAEIQDAIVEATEDLAATIIGQVDLTGLVYGGGGDLDGLDLNLKVDGGGTQTVTFAAPTDENDVVAQILAQTTGITPSLDVGDLLKLESDTTGDGSQLDTLASTSLTVLGLPVGVATPAVNRWAFWNLSGIPITVDTDPQNWVTVWAGGVTFWSGSVQAVATDNVSLTGPVTADGVVLGNGQYILLIGQTDPIENGPWEVNTGGAWLRGSPDNLFHDGIAVSGGISYKATAGSIYKDRAFILAAPVSTSVLVGTDPQIWVLANTQDIDGFGPIRIDVNFYDMVMGRSFYMQNPNATNAFVCLTMPEITPESAGKEITFVSYFGKKNKMSSTTPFSGFGFVAHPAGSDSVTPSGPPGESMLLGAASGAPQVVRLISDGVGTWVTDMPNNASIKKWRRAKAIP